MLKGVNFNNLNALGLWQASDIDKINVGPGDYEKVSQMGANHVRFGLSYQWYEQDPVEFFSVLDQHVQWARDNNLWIILVDFTLPYLGENTDDWLAHPLGGCYQGYGNPCNFWGDEPNEEAARLAFKEFWYDIVSHYENNDTVAGYDFINEPWAQDESYQKGIHSSRYYEEIVDGIVENNHNATQLFFLESEPEPLSWIYFLGYSPGSSLINSLKSVTNNRIVMSVHMYRPQALTHYEEVVYPTLESGVEWNQSSMTDPTAPEAFPGDVVKTIYTSGSITVNSVTYNSVDEYLTDYPHDIRTRFGLIFSQQTLGVPIYIGEWSAQQTEDSGGNGWYTNTFIDYNIDIANLFDSWEVHDAVYTFKAGPYNWGLFISSTAQPAGQFNPSVASNPENPTETIQPFIDALTARWNLTVKPDFTESGGEPDPTPTPTPEPSPDPTPDPSPEPSPDPSPEPSPDPSPEPSPEPSPSPTPIPAVFPSPSPVTNTAPKQVSFSKAEAPTCQDIYPVGIVDLFQIDREGSAATLFFTPLTDANQYSVVFGYEPNDERFGGIDLASTDLNNGVQSITVNYLDPTRQYSFKILPTNGCAAGAWSNWLNASGQPENLTTLQRFYRYTQELLN